MRGAYTLLPMKRDALPVISISEAADLHQENLGWLDAPSGRLVFGDPFQGMSRYHNAGLDIPPGRYRVVRSTRQGEPAFLSVVLDEDAFANRLNAKEQHILEIGLDDNDDPAPLWLASPSGSIGVCDAQQFSQGMPADSSEPGESWYDLLFEHGLDGSWFDQLDAAGQVGVGAAMIPLPHAAGTIAVAQGAIGPKRAFLEIAADDRPVALHLTLD